MYILLLIFVRNVSEFLNVHIFSLIDKRNVNIFYHIP